MIAIGIGATSSAAVEDVLLAVASTGSLASEHALVFATFDGAACVSVIQRAAEQAGARFQTISRADLAARAHECLSTSRRALDHVGVPCVAEAAALAAAGPASRLIAPRQIAGPVTVAVASGISAP